MLKPSDGLSIGTQVGAFVLFFVVGLAPWLLVNALWSEVPILISRTPESYTITAWITVAVQGGNLMCFAYNLFIQHRIKPKYAFIPILLILLSAPIVSLMIAGFWQTQTEINHKQHSVVFNCLSILCGMIGALSVITIFPWASMYGATLVAAVSTGSGANGLVTAIIAVSQNPAADSPRFGFHVYFLIIAGILCLSIMAFLAIIVFPVFELFKEPDITSEIVSGTTIYSAPSPDDDDYLSPNIYDSSKKNPIITPPRSYKDIYQETSVDATPENPRFEDGMDFDQEGNRIFSDQINSLMDDDNMGSNYNNLYDSYGPGPITPLLKPQEPTQMPTMELLLFIKRPVLYQFYINVLYYLILGLIPFVFESIKDDEKRRTFVFWTNMVGMALGSVSRLITFKWRIFYPRLLSILQTPFFLFIFIMCFVQHFKIPMFLHIFSVISYGIFSMFFGYADTINFQIPLVMLQGFPKEIQRASQFVALANQLGSLLGAMIGFTLTMTVFK